MNKIPAKGKKESSSSKYETIKEIGVGSFGKAILVKSRENGKLFVMKRINMKEMSREEQEGAMNEVKVLQLLKHPNIIAYHEYYKSDDGYLNIIMEHADGGDLFQRIRSVNNVHFDEEVRLLVKY
jgi:serine/threonine protein kinase